MCTKKGTEYSSKNTEVKTLVLSVTAAVHCLISRMNGSVSMHHVHCAVSVEPLRSYLQYDVVSGLSDALLRLGAVLAGQRDGRLVQAPVLLTLQLQNKHLHWGKESTQNTQSWVYTLTNMLDFFYYYFKYWQ